MSGNTPITSAIPLNTLNRRGRPLTQTPGGRNEQSQSTSPGGTPRRRLPGSSPARTGQNPSGLTRAAPAVLRQPPANAQAPMAMRPPEGTITTPANFSQVTPTAATQATRQVRLAALFKKGWKVYHNVVERPLGCPRGASCGICCVVMSATGCCAILDHIGAIHLFPDQNNSTATATSSGPA